jgi:hypothetical protein
MWSAKESLFKWYSLGGIDFKEHLQLSAPITQIAGGQLHLPFVCKKQNAANVIITGQLFRQMEMALGWLAT